MRRCKLSGQEAVLGVLQLNPSKGKCTPFDVDGREIFRQMKGARSTLKCIVSKQHMEAE
jgi:hypothetical protein